MTCKSIQDITFSKHSKVRIQQRGISQESVISVITLGKKIHKQSLKFFYVPKSTIKGLPIKEQECLANLIVITDHYQSEVITCYKSQKAVHKIRKKSKRLRKTGISGKWENTLPS